MPSSSGASAPGSAREGAGQRARGARDGAAHGIDDLLNPPGKPKETAFILLVAGFGDIKGGRVNYISNGDRADCISMLHEILARFEGRASFDEPPSEAKQ